MSDTPRTDALGNKWSASEGATNSTCSLEAAELYALARQLEYELAAALKAKEELTAELQRVNGYDKYLEGQLKACDKAKEYRIYKACPKHQGLWWNFPATVANPAVDVCPHCEQEAMKK